MYRLIAVFVVVFIMFAGCARSRNPANPDTDSGMPEDTSLSAQTLAKYPSFFTSNEDYFITRIGDVPAIDKDSFRLIITGAVQTPCSLTLAGLYALPQVELPLTIECIGNSSAGKRVATAVWKGFNVYRLLDSLGMDSTATGVKYTAADGYYATHTIDQLINNNVLGALFMNGDTIPPIQGFPLRVINPGFYGAKQPAWVVTMEVITMPDSDYWDDRGWDTSPAMAIDTKFFFPAANESFHANDSFEIGGAAFGGTRVEKVEYSTDNRATWRQARIIKQIDADNVWVFWYAKTALSETGAKLIYSRGTDMHGAIQPETDSLALNGSNTQPSVLVNIVP